MSTPTSARTSLTAVPVQFPIAESLPKANETNCVNAPRDAVYRTFSHSQECENVRTGGVEAKPGSVSPDSMVRFNVESSRTVVLQHADVMRSECTFPHSETLDNY